MEWKLPVNEIQSIRWADPKPSRENSNPVQELLTQNPEITGLPEVQVAGIKFRTKQGLFCGLT